MKPWKRIEPTTVHQVGWRTITTKTFQMPDGREATFDTWRAEGAEVVLVIALTTDKQVILARQFRVGPEEVLEEIPAGMVEEGETPEYAAQKELLEETGYKAGNMQYVGQMYRDGYSNLVIHVFLATDCTPDKNGQRLEKDEYIEVDLISIDRLFENAKKAKMIDVGAVFMAYDELQKIKEQ